MATCISRNTIRVNLYGRNKAALIDTGASVSCLRKSELDEYVSKGAKIKITPCDIKNVVGVGGEKHEVLGKVVLSFYIEKLKVDQSFIVLESLHHPIILGLDFMSAKQVHIDFHRQLLTLADDLVSVYMMFAESGGTVRSLKSEVFVPVKVPESCANKSVLLEPFEELSKSQLGGAKCLVQTKGTHSVFRLMNPTAIDVTVKRNLKGEWGVPQPKRHA